MTIRSFARTAIVSACFAGIAMAAQAGGHAKTESSGHPGVDARKAVMKDIGGNLKKVKSFVAGEGGDAAMVASAAASIAASAAEIQYIFDDQVHVDNAGDVKTTASADIWSKWDEFKTTAADLETAAVALAAAAASGDANAIKAGFGATAKNCGACHKPFRVKK